MYESGEPEKEGIRIISEQQKMLSTLVRQERRLYQDVAPNAASKASSIIQTDPDRRQDVETRSTPQ